MTQAQRRCLLRNLQTNAKRKQTSQAVDAMVATATGLSLDRHKTVVIYATVR